MPHTDINIIKIVLISNIFPVMELSKSNEITLLYRAMNIQMSGHPHRRTYHFTQYSPIPYLVYLLPRPHRLATLHCKTLLTIPPPIHPILLRFQILIRYQLLNFPLLSPLTARFHPLPSIPLTPLLPRLILRLTKRFSTIVVGVTFSST